MRKAFFTIVFILIVFCFQLDLAKAESKLQWLYIENNMIRDSVGSFFLVGTNVRGQAYNPARDGRYDDWYIYRNQDAINIQSFGINSIRLLVYWEVLETSSSPSEFSYNQSYIEMIRQTVEAYNAKGIYVMIDLHEHPDGHRLGRFIPTSNDDDTEFADAFYSDTSATSAREHLKNLWLTLSQTFKNYSGVVGYDLMNEPHHCCGSLTNQQVSNLWFDISDYVISAMRANGDNHIIFVNFCPWARSAQFVNRKLNDNNVLYSPHFYYGIDMGIMTATNNDYNWLQTQFNSYVKSQIEQFNIPFAFEEQGFGSAQINSGDPQDIWLKNMLNISNTSSLLQGWFYFCYYGTYGGGPMIGGGWQGTMTNFFANKPMQVHYMPTILNVSGKLKDANSNPVLATITFYQPGTSTLNAVNQTGSDGSYGMPVISDVYDIQYNILNFFIPNFWIRLSSINVSSDIRDLVNYVTWHSSENKTSFTVNMNNSQSIQTYSPNKPYRVLINGTALSEVSSLSNLKDNTWFYSSSEQKIYMIINLPTLVVCGDGRCDAGENNANCPGDCPLRCSDGTAYGTCSSNKPFYCSNGNLIERCSLCGCYSYQNCDVTEKCIPKSTVIFQDDFETGDLSKWTGTNGVPAVTSTQKYLGNYSAEDDASGDFLYKDFAAQTTVFVRGYFRFSNLPSATGQQIRFMQIATGSGSYGTFFGRLILTYSGAGQILSLNYWYPSPGGSIVYPINLQPNTWHSYEFKFVKHQTNGEYRAWVDGNEIITLTNIDTSGAPDVSKIAVGEEYISGMAATTWVDSVVVSTSYVGP